MRADHLLDTLGDGEAFENGGFSHGVDAGPHLLRVRTDVDQLQGFVCVLVPYQDRESQDSTANHGRSSRSTAHKPGPHTQLSSRLEAGPKDGRRDVRRLARGMVQQLRQRLNVCPTCSRPRLHTRTRRDQTLSPGRGRRHA